MENEFLLKKNGQAILNMSKILIGLENGSRMDSIPTYSERFGLSVGTIQKAMKFLEEKGLVIFERKGYLGTIAQEIKYDKLINFAGFNNLVCVMPLPYSKRYEGLATGLKKVFLNKKIDFYFAYMGGSDVRIDFLEKGRCDFIIISKLAMLEALKQGKNIEGAYKFGEGTYVGKHVLLKGKEKNIKRIGIDSTSRDQYLLTLDYFKDKNPEYVEIDYNKIPKLLQRNIIDAAVWNLDEIIEQNMDISYEELPNEKMVKLANEAVLVVKKDNELLKSIADKIISKDYIIKIQKDILDGSLFPSY